MWEVVQTRTYEPPVGVTLWLNPSLLALREGIARGLHFLR